VQESTGLTAPTTLALSSARTVSVGFVTVRTAGALSTLPPRLRTSTVYEKEPTAGSVTCKRSVVAPAMATPSRFH